MGRSPLKGGIGKKGKHCNLTLLFAFPQAVACAGACFATHLSVRWPHHGLPKAKTGNDFTNAEAPALPKN
jgi:hypothetical protein